MRTGSVVKLKKEFRALSNTQDTTFRLITSAIVLEEGQVGTVVDFDDRHNAWLVKFPLCGGIKLEVFISEDFLTELIPPEDVRKIIETIHLVNER